MNVTNTALNSSRTSAVRNLQSSSPNPPSRNLFKRIGAAVKQLAREMPGTERVPDKKEPDVQTLSRNMQACSDTVVKAIEVLVGGGIAGSPHSMLLSPVEINSTVKAFGEYFGYASALSQLHLALVQPIGLHEPPSAAELQNALKSLGNNLPERIRDIARPTLGELVRNIPKRVLKFAPSLRLSSNVAFARNLGPSAVELLKALNEHSAETGLIGTHVDLSLSDLKALSQMLADYVRAMPKNAPQRVDVRCYMQHIECKITQARVVGKLGLNTKSLDAKSLIGTCSDVDVLKAVLTQDGLLLQFVSKELQANQAVVMTAVQQNGLALGYASHQLQSNPDVVMAAVQQEGFALSFACTELRNDAAIVMAAVQQRGQAICHASQEMMENLAVVLAAIRQNRSAFVFVGPALRNDLKVIAAFRQLRA